MKTLILSDLHFSVADVTSIWRLEKLVRRFEASHVPIDEADIVIITGDIFECRIYAHDGFDPFETLNVLFKGKPVVFCLGNHEFAYQEFSDVEKYWKRFTSDHIFCLDVVNKVDIDGFTFVGNVFWYDFSLNQNRLLMKGEIVSNWLDSSIKSFDPIKENEKCQEKIISSLNKKNKNILVTHMVPHELMNWFSLDDPTSVYNAYSGNKDFLKKIKDKNVIWSFCGHTHKRMSDVIYDINCLNIGNDYFHYTNKINYVLMDL